MIDAEFIRASAQYAWFWLLSLLIQIGPTEFFFDVFRALVDILFPSVGGS